MAVPANPAVATHPVSLIAYIVDQPPTDYRFRYHNERARTILYSGNATAANPRYVTACLVTDPATLPLLRGPVTVTVSTVNDEGLIHPYYMVGNSCDDSGIFRTQVDQPGPTVELPDGNIGVYSVALENVAIFCVGRNEEAMRQVLRARIAAGVVPYVHRDTENAHEVYMSDTAMLKSLRLAFTFFYHETGQVFRADTDKITKAPKKRLNPPEIYPSNLPLVQQPDQEHKVWVYIDGLAKGSKFQFSLVPQNSYDTIAVIQYRPIRKNLLELTLRINPAVQLPPAERIQCELRITEGGHERSGDLFLHPTRCPQCCSKLMNDEVPVPEPMQQDPEQQVSMDDLLRWMQEAGSINNLN